MIGIPKAEIMEKLGMGLCREPGTTGGVLRLRGVLRLNRSRVMSSGLYSKAHRIQRKQKASGNCQQQSDTVSFEDIPLA